MSEQLILPISDRELAASLQVCGAMKRVDHNTVRTCTRLVHTDTVHVHERPGHRVVWKEQQS